MTFTPEQIVALNAKLDPSAVSERSQSGRTFSYVEGWHAIAEASRIFGFDAWTRETVECKCVTEKERAVSGQPGYGVTYIARVRVTIDDVVREGTGAGHGIDKDLGLAHESAIKEAETDAMKRALMTFGNPFGLALYDKTKANVGSNDSGRKSAAQAKRDGDHERIKDELAKCVDLEQLGAWGARLPDMLESLPHSWADPVHDLYLARRSELLEKEAA